MINYILNKKYYIQLKIFYITKIKIMKTIYYWCPYISKVATVRAVIKSAEAIKKFSNNELDPIIINVAGEWEAFKKDNKFQIKIIDLTKSKILNNNNWTGFYRSRFIYIYLFL